MDKDGLGDACDPNVTPIDAGVDSGSSGGPGIEGGLPDAGGSGGTGGSTPRGDTSGSDDGGCGCRVPTFAEDATWSRFGLLLALCLGLRRRRTRHAPRA